MASQLVSAIDQKMAQTGVPGLPDHASRTLRERMEKFENLRKRGRRRSGRVTIEDLPTEPVK